MAIDLGASAGRLVAGTVANGRIALTELGRFRTPIIDDPAGGYQCWDTDAMLARIQSHLAAAVAKAPIDSLGVDSWGVDYLLLDADLKRIGKPVCYRDKRTDGVMQRIHQRIPTEEIYRRTGIQFQPFNTLYQLAASIEREPEWMEQARHLLMIPDYLHFCFSGTISNEYSNSTTTQMLALDGAWDESLLAAIGVKRGLMQPPVAAATILGETVIGPARIQVIAPASHDTASAVTGTPLESADEAYISSGTWSLMGIESLVPIATPEAMRLNFTNEGGIEKRYRVLKNIMGLWPLQRLCEEHHVADVTALIRQAEAAKPWRSVIDLDQPQFLNPKSMTTAIEDECQRVDQQIPESIVPLARCIFDSLALSYRKTKDEIESLSGRRLARIRIVGGGCQNQLLNQLCADACQLPVVAGPVEASALGNLAAQMIALGVIAGLDAARALIRASFNSREYLPKDAVPAAVYRDFLHTNPTAALRGVPSV